MSDVPSCVESQGCYLIIVSYQNKGFNQRSEDATQIQQRPESFERLSTPLQFLSRLLFFVFLPSIFLGSTDQRQGCCCFYLPTFFSLQTALKPADETRTGKQDYWLVVQNRIHTNLTHCNNVIFAKGFIILGIKKNTKRAFGPVHTYGTNIFTAKYRGTFHVSKHVKIKHSFLAERYYYIGNN